MNTPGETNPGTSENQPMATDAEQDALMLQAGALFAQAFEGYKEAIEEPDEPMPDVLGVTPKAEELAQYPTLQQWDTADIQYVQAQKDESGQQASPPHVLATFARSGTDQFEAIDLTPSFVKSDPMSDEEHAAHHVVFSEGLSHAKAEDIANLLGATVTTERLDFPGLPPEAPSLPPPLEQ